MRRELLTDPLLLIERIGEWATRRRRLRRLRGSPAAGLTKDHIDSLELLDLVAAEAGAPRVIYDVGANVGTWTQLAKSIFPYAEVHAFEPLAKHTREFDEVTKGLTNVHLHAVALGARKHEATIHVTDFSDASSLLPLADRGRKQWNIDEVESITVKVVPLDQLIAEKGLPPPDLIKLDVQGFELDVLKGARAALEKATSVLTEVSFAEYYVGQCLAHELSALLAESG